MMSTNFTLLIVVVVLQYSLKDVLMARKQAAMRHNKDSKKTIFKVTSILLRTVGDSVTDSVLSIATPRGALFTDPPAPAPNTPARGARAAAVTH